MKDLLQTQRRPDIVFRHNGRIDISARAVRLLGAQSGDVLGILEDGKEYYLYIRLHAPVVGRHEGKTYKDSSWGDHMRSYSQRLARIMLAICGVADKARLTVADPIDIPPYGTALPIITKRLL